MFTHEVEEMTRTNRAVTGSELVRYRIDDSALGKVLIAATARGICAVLFGEDVESLEEDLCNRFPDATLTAGNGEFDRLADGVLAFIDAPARTVEFPLDPYGTDFQRRVWRALGEIAPGDTASYKDVATRIGSPGAVRAVARACAANPIAVAIPCHRVVRSDGSMSGYRWGVARKRALLRREAAA